MYQTTFIYNPLRFAWLSPHVAFPFAPTHLVVSCIDVLIVIVITVK